MTKTRPFRTRLLSSKIFWIAAFLLIVVLIAALNSSKFGAFKEALTPPRLPEVAQVSKRYWLEQNWNPQLRNKYHHISQGTRTLPLPLSWFLALERPAGSLWSLPFGNKGKFADDEYLLRFGFIDGEESVHNPYGLPIGFATTPNQNMSGIDGKVSAIGFNCAACHTGHFIYGDTEYIVEGGPATTDLGQLTKALGAALGQTLVSSKVPLVGGRFDRFAKNVLGDDAYSDIAANKLAQELENLVQQLAELPGDVDVIEGFSRLDALNRIGNQVFALDPGRYDNYVPINAPVNYPHIWTSSWFSWVQYDGSIMNPLVRNTGEAMGVSAYVNTDSPLEEQRFSSSIQVPNLYWIEKSLSGTDPLPEKKFNGLQSPPWPDTLPAIDPQLAGIGASLYQVHCKECHLAAPNTEEFWTHFKPLEYYIDGKKMQSTQALLDVHMIPLAQVGTDPAQSNVLIDRTVNTAGIGNESVTANTGGLGIDTEVCTREAQLPNDPYNPRYPDDKRYPPGAPTHLVNVKISDGPDVSFALALGGIVQQVNDMWFQENYVPKSQQDVYTEARPNCLQAGLGYKSRPLNGVWATAPFLHNGSVPTVMDLLSPPDERPQYVLLGNTKFDAVKLGLAQDPQLLQKIRQGKKYTKQGFFVLDTSVPGNHNHGHEFSERYDDDKEWWQQEEGVIGPELSLDQRRAIIEYLKTF